MIDCGELERMAADALRLGRGTGAMESRLSGVLLCPSDPEQLKSSA
jgi:hypothetical protein